MKDDEFGVFLELTPMQLILTDEQKTEIVPLPWDSSEYDDYRVSAEEEQEQYRDPGKYDSLAAEDARPSSSEEEERKKDEEYYEWYADAQYAEYDFGEEDNNSEGDVS